MNRGDKVKIRELISALSAENPSSKVFIQDERGEYLDIVEVKKVLFEREVLGNDIILVSDS